MAHFSEPENIPVLTVKCAAKIDGIFLSSLLDKFFIISVTACDKYSIISFELFK